MGQLPASGVSLPRNWSFSAMIILSSYRYPRELLVVAPTFANRITPTLITNRSTLPVEFFLLLTKHILKHISVRSGIKNIGRNSTTWIRKSRPQGSQRFRVCKTFLARDFPPARALSLRVTSTPISSRNTTKPQSELLNCISGIFVA
jgi:hypothetical protein